jgi:tetratricopeptide (TPR) repeat protein
MRTAEVERALKRYPSPSDVPLAEIVRARLAYFQNRESASVMAYESAISLGPGRDGLWYETAQALATLGFNSRSKDYLEQLARAGSRNPDVYYRLAMIAATDDQQDEAETELMRAWKMRPVPREWLVKAGVFWSVLRRPSMTSVISISQAAEPQLASRDTSTRPIRIPATAMSRVAGEYLHIQIGEQELSVPGGAVIAPIGSPAVDAESWSRSERELGLADAPRIATLAQNAGAFTQPALRRRVERTVDALAASNRWSEVVEITNGISPTSEHVPVALFFHRANALQRMQRHDDAKRLAVQLAASPVLTRKKDAKSMEELAGMLSSMDLFDAAVRMLDRAAAIRPNPFTDDRARQIQMNKYLQTGYSSVKTPHFEVHFPSEMNRLGAEQIAKILEAEQARLQKWVPVPNMTPVVVNVLRWEDFRATYTGNDFILGFYNGKITVPLAGVPDLVPEVVTLLTHELCHAMIAQATNDQAPHWFHEGLAQRVEMRRYHANAFNMYDDDRLLSVALLDAVITGSPDPEMIGEAYIESQSIIRYLEAAYGPQSVGKMLAAFRAGADTSGALRAAAGLDVAAFDMKLRAWGRNGAKVFDNPPPIHYEQEQPYRKVVPQSRRGF